MSQVSDFAVRGNYVPFNMSLDFFKCVGLGWIKGGLPTNKFACSPDIDIVDCPVDIWPRKHDLTWSDVGASDIDSISSSSTSDVGNLISIYGLDANGDIATETVALNGQTRVALSRGYQHVWLMINLGSTALAGVVYVYVNSAIVGGVPSDNTKIRNLIDNGDNQSVTTQFRVPRGYYMVVNHVDLSLHRSLVATHIGAVFDFKSRGYSAATGHTSWQTKGRITLDTGGTSTWGRDYPMLCPLIPEYSDTKIQVYSTTGNSISVTGSYDFVLLKAEYINTEDIYITPF